MKSKTVKLISAVVVLGVLSGAYAGVKSYVASQEKKEEEESDTSVSLIDVSSDDVASVSFTADDEKVTLEKSDDSWSKKDETDFPLNQDTVNSAVNNLVSLDADQELTDADDLSQYDLDDPQNEITLTTSDGTETVIRVGMKNDSTSQYYVQKGDDEKTVYVVASSSLESFMGTLYDFAESGTFPTITSSTITDIKVDKDNGYEISKDSDTLYWNVSDGKTAEKADSTKSNNLASAISSLSYDKFVDYNCTDDSKYGFDDPYAVITVKYTEQQEVQKDSDTSESTDSDTTEETVSEDAETSTDTEAAEDSESTEEDADVTESESEETSEEETDSSDNTEETTDEETTDSSSDSTESDSEETDTITVDKELTIYIGDKTDDSYRYIKVNDSNEVYTVSESSLTDILDVTVSDFYSLTVNYLSVQNLDALKIETPDDTHTVNIIRTTTKDEDDEDAKETTTLSYNLDGKDLDETKFDTFYNKINNMTAQERLMEEYKPDGDPAYTFTLSDVNGNTTVIKYYSYDTNFYAAVVDDEKVYLVNKMNLKEVETAYQDMLASDSSEETTEETSSESAEASETTEEASESSETTETESSSEETTDSETTEATD